MIQITPLRGRRPSSRAAIAIPATVATFDFAYLVLAAVWGIIFFGEILDLVTIAGMALILVAGVLAVRR